MRQVDTLPRCRVTRRIMFPTRVVAARLRGPGSVEVYRCTECGELHLVGSGSGRRSGMSRQLENARKVGRARSAAARRVGTKKR